MGAETHQFQAEVNALLGLVTNSLYTNSEVFLRELVSNASDALDKARFEALVQANLRDKELEPEIRITADKANKLLVIEDSGIGMTRDEAAKNLGTIAHSGTLQFLEEANKRGKSDIDLIGQFGVGFYSAFMVAEQVIVDTLSATAGSEPVRWSSKGDGRFDLGPGERTKRGTRIELHLKEDALEFLGRHKVEAIVRRYSNYVVHPIRLVEVDDEGKSSDPEQINAASPIWARSSGDPTDEEYLEFYKHAVGGFILPGDEPVGRIHFSADAPIQFHALLFVPGQAPADLFMDDRKAIQLYARRILIMESCEQLLPPYLRFLRGVVDSQDLPLNVSREMLQEHKSLAAIRRQLTRKALKLLDETATENAEAYAKVWEHFGSVLKEGLHLDGKHKSELLALARWKSLGHGDDWVSLAQYAEAMAEDQEHIYYIAGADEQTLRRSPHLEGLRKKGVDVLLMTDAVDEWVLQSVSDYEGKSFRSVTQGELEDTAGDETGEDGDDGAEASHGATEIDALIEKAKAVLGNRVRDVRASKRLEDSAACLVDPAGGISHNMQRILTMARGQADAALPARILELNPKNDVVRAANELCKSSPDDARLPDWIELLNDLATLADGKVVDPAATVGRLQTMMAQVVAK